MHNSIFKIGNHTVQKYLAILAECRNIRKEEPNSNGPIIVRLSLSLSFSLSLSVSPE